MTRLKVYLIVIGILIVLLVLKTHFLDGYEPELDIEKLRKSSRMESFFMRKLSPWDLSSEMVKRNVKS